MLKNDIFYLFFTKFFIFLCFLVVFCVFLWFFILLTSFLGWFSLFFYQNTVDFCHFFVIFCLFFCRKLCFFKFLVVYFHNNFNFFNFLDHFFNFLWFFGCLYVNFLWFLSFFKKFHRCLSNFFDILCVFTIFALISNEKNINCRKTPRTVPPFPFFDQLFQVCLWRFET